MGRFSFRPTVLHCYLFLLLVVKKCCCGDKLAIVPNGDSPGTARSMSGKDAQRIGAMAMERFNALVMGEMKSCQGHQKMAFVGSVDNPMADSMVKYFSERIPYFVHIDSPTAYGMFYYLYVTEQVMTYVVLTSDPDGVMKSAESLFHLHRTGRLFAMPHRTQWLVITQSARQFERFVSDQARSVFDHVAVLHVSLHPPSTMDIQQGITLEWQENRTRRPSPFIFSSSSKCFVFPNKRFGMNQRRLTVVAKLFNEAFFRVEINVTTGESQYNGLNYQILKDISQLMNFTFVFDPPPTALMSSSWLEVSDIVATHRADFGIDFWPQNCAMVQSLVTYPIYFDQIIGFYIPVNNTLHFSTFWICPFPPIAYLFLAACLLYVSIVYTTGKLGVDAILDSSHTSSSDAYCGSTAVKSSVLELFGSTVWSLLMSVMNQGTLPRPRTTSCKLIFGFWSLGLVVFYGAFTAYLTSTLVGRDPDIPLKTYEDLLVSNTYRWGTWNETCIEAMMRTSTNPTVKQLVRRGLLWEWDTNVRETSKDFSVLFRTGELVVFMYSNYPELLKKDLGIMSARKMTKKLLSANMGYIVTKNSELNDMLSSQIIALHEHGIVDKYFANMTKRYKQDDIETSEEQDKRAAIANLASLLALVGLLLCLAVVILILENVVYRWKQYAEGDKTAMPGVQSGEHVD